MNIRMLLAAFTRSRASTKKMFSMCLVRFAYPCGARLTFENHGLAFAFNSGLSDTVTVYVSGEQRFSVVEVVEGLLEVQVHKHMSLYSRTTTFTLPQHFDIRLVRAQCFDSGAVLWDLGEVEGARAASVVLLFQFSSSKLDANKGRTFAINDAHVLDIS
ncbi:hypothetical protein ARMGADRAFT_1037242 [Armillaria gallica]|uniref:Uncharacterized protein n=1 Tax=Armillaria gallica TaxID=47427 RepID=A0A2H3CMR8_ARMGA|nr:hypothetical protein ARMGADRAFT_1037242 [Armillaria gallica]